MKTQVIMKRKLFNSEIKQQSKTEFFSATDLVRAGNLFRNNKNIIPFNFSAFLKNKNTKIFIDSLNKKYGNSIIKGRGRNSNTWVHPLLFIDIALAINPGLKIEVYEWIMDSLLRHRNNSGDSYKKMTGALWANAKNKSTFPKSIIATAKLIQKACKVNSWQKATETQLQLRDKIHENISLLCDVLKDNNQAIRLGILKSIN